MREAQTAVRLILLALLVASLETADVRDGRGRGRLGRLADTMRDRILDAVDPDEIVDRLEVNALADRVDVDAVVSRVDVDALLSRVDVDALLDRVDVNRLLSRVDLVTLLSRVDVDALLDRVKVDRLLSRVDVDALLDRVDVDRLVSRVDVDTLVDRVDVERIVQRARIPELVARGTGNVAESAFDLLRRQLLALDVVVTRSVLRMLRRDPARLPAGPSVLVGDPGRTPSLPAPNAPLTDVTGHYAGPVTRLVAHLADSAVAGTAFTVMSGVLLAALRAVGASADEVDHTGVVFLGTLAAWVFAYWWASTSVAGRTPGMALVGLRVMGRTGRPLSGRRALVRVLVLPVSLVLVGVGVAGLLLDRERRALHDVLAGSTVVYDWGDRRATLPTPLAHWLARHAAPVDR